VIMGVDNASDGDGIGNNDACVSVAKPLEPKFSVSKVSSDKNPDTTAIDAATVLMSDEITEITRTYVVKVKSENGQAGTTAAVIDKPNVPAGMEITGFTSNGESVEGHDGAYTLSEGVEFTAEQLAAGEVTKEFTVVVNYSVDISAISEQGFKDLQQCQPQDGVLAPNSRLGMFNLVEMADDSDAPKDANNWDCTPVIKQGTPHISLKKYIKDADSALDFDDAQSTPGVELTPDGDMTIKYVVNNDGDTNVFDIYLVDDVTAGKDQDSIEAQIKEELSEVPRFNLAPGESKAIEITVKAPTAQNDQHTNVAQAIGTPPDPVNPDQPGNPDTPVKSSTDPANGHTPPKPETPPTKPSTPPTPPVVPPVTTTTTVSEKPSTPPTPPVSTTTTAPERPAEPISPTPAPQPKAKGHLANTGASVLGLVGVALVLIVAGLFFARRREEN
ncbi:LPXTG cell wall anchor domain-containing protein, partial [Corynebacterium aurimucosum]